MIVVIILWENAELLVNIPAVAFTCTLENPNPCNCWTKLASPSSTCWHRLWHRCAANLRSILIHNYTHAWMQRTTRKTSPYTYRYRQYLMDMNRYEPHHSPHDGTILTIHFCQLLYPLHGCIARGAFQVRTKQHSPLNPAILGWKNLKQPNIYIYI